MGDISHKDEVVLMVFPGPERNGLLDRIRKEFPNYEVIYYQQTNDSNNRFGAPGTGVDVIPDELWKKVTVLITLRTFPPKIEDAPNLSVVHLLSAGVDKIVKQPIYTDTDITITTSSGIHGPAIAEWTIMSVLAGTKNFPALYENQKKGWWNSDKADLSATPDYVGGTIGVLGYGSIGRQVARVFNSLGAKIHAFTASPRTSDESKRDDGYIVPGTGDPDGSIPQSWYSGKAKADLHKFLRSGLDVAFISVPLTPATKHMMGREEFELLYQAAREKIKKENDGVEVVKDGEALPPHVGTYVVNISRGPIIEQESLIEYLTAGKLRGAALDVTDPEPLPKENELWRAKNTIVTPHISAMSKGYMARAVDVLRVNLERKERGEKLFNEVDRRRGY